MKQSAMIVNENPKAKPIAIVIDPEGKKRGEEAIHNIETSTKIYKMEEQDLLVLVLE